MRAWVVVVGFLVGGVAHAQSPDFGGAGDRAPLGYHAAWLPTQRVTGQASDFGLVRQQLNVGLPVYLADNNQVIALFSARHSLFQTDAVLPDSRQAFPTSLTNIQMGGLYRHTFANQWQLMTIANVASASDIPFHGLREINPTLLTALTVPAGGDDAWQFSLFYAPAGQFLFPLPGIAYRWVPDETLQVTLGLPMRVRWQPQSDWTLEASYTPLTNVRARVTWNFATPWSAYAGYEWANETFLLVGRRERRERFYADEMRFEAGLTGEVAEHWRLGIFGGYAFQRRYWRGENFFSNRQDELRIDAGPYLGVRLEWRF